MLRLLLASFAIGALPVLGCTPPLTPDDARPFQSCSVDADCTLEDLGCTGCGPSFVAIAQGQRADFEALRGCWDSPIDPFSKRCAAFKVFTPVACEGGRCSLSRVPTPGPGSK